MNLSLCDNAEVPISVNIWDDYLDGESTYLYIESFVKHDTSVRLLYVLKGAIDREFDIVTEIKEYDSYIKHPKLKEIGIPQLKRWELVFNVLSYELKDKIVEFLNKKYPNVNAYSES